MLRRLRSRRRTRGQSLVEFALTLPVLVLILLLAIDLGRIYFGWINLQNVARIGASYAALHPDAWGSPGNAAQRTAYTAQMSADANSINCASMTAASPAFPDGTDLGDRAEVNVTCQFSVLTPIVSAIVGNPVQLGASAIFPIRAGLVNLAQSTPPPTSPPTIPPTPTPTATPTPCVVPNFIGTGANQAQQKWNKAGFLATHLSITVGKGNYTINTETPAGLDGSLQDCDNFQLTVGP